MHALEARLYHITKTLRKDQFEKSDFNMEWTKYFCCSRVDRRYRQQNRTLRHIGNRRPAVKNVYSLLTPTHSSPRDAVFANARFFKANCNFAGYDPTEMTFSAGDILEVDEAHSNRYIYRARHVRNGLIGYVSKAFLDTTPIIELQPWYFHNISRQEARAILLSQQDIGTFMVRKSCTKGQEYSLSIRSEDNGHATVMHYKIHKNPNGYYISEGCYVKYLDGLIKLYQDDIQGRLKLNPKLKHACKRDARYKISLDDLENLL